MSGVPVVGRYVSRSWSSASGVAGGGGRQASPSPHHRPPSTSRRTPWRLPAFFRRRLEIAQRGGGRVGSTEPGEGEGGVGVKEEAFKDPADPLKDTKKEVILKDVMRESCSGDPIKDFEAAPSAITYEDPEIHDLGVREPRYLDLFDPGVSVVRDPKLDLPPPKGKSRARSLIATCLASLASTRVIVCCSIVLVVMVVVIITLITSSHHSLPPDPRIKPPHVTTVTTCGLVQGVVEGDAFVFRGVPYAVPPIGSRRFRRSHPHTKLEDCWTGTYVANVTRPCWGYDSQGAVVEGFEDCLLLDVFTPQLGYDTPLPVVVVVGGGSLGGDTQRQWMVSKAAELSPNRRTVIVSPQIRRGPFGFLPHPSIAASTYPHTAGNQGASDLLSALTWTQHNVEHFGGDPERVTLFGHQSGAALAWPLLSSPSGRDLVHFAWLSGAAPLHPTVPWRDADPELIEAFNCSSVACLESLSPREVMETPPLEWRRPGKRAWLVADGVMVSFVPSVPQVPIVLGSTLQVSAKSLLSWKGRLGTSRTVMLDAILEGIELSSQQQPPPQPDQVTLVYKNKEFWPTPLYVQREAEMEKARERVALSEVGLNRYSELIADPWLLLTTLLSDATTTCPTLTTASTLAKGTARNQRKPTTKPVYSYLVSHTRATRFGTLSDGSMDLEALLGLMVPQSRSDIEFIGTLQDLFFRFVSEGVPEMRDSTPAHLGVYVIGEKVVMEKSRMMCEVWANASDIATRF